MPFTAANTIYIEKIMGKNFNSPAFVFSLHRFKNHISIQKLLATLNRRLNSRVYWEEIPYWQ